MAEWPRSEKSTRNNWDAWYGPDGKHGLEAHTVYNEWLAEQRSARVLKKQNQSAVAKAANASKRNQA